VFEATSIVVVLIEDMGSQVQDEALSQMEDFLQEQDTSFIKQCVEEIDEFLKFNRREQKTDVKEEQKTDNEANTVPVSKKVTKQNGVDKEEKKTDEDANKVLVPKKTVKRKRKLDFDVSLNVLTDIFLRILYPISRCMTKGISVGLVKSQDYSPNAILNHGAKMLFFSENAWESFMKHLHLIECYLAKNMFGKKTSVRLLECDIEIDILKYRGDLQVRFRDLTKHDEKIQLSREEFYILSCATSSLTRYMKQLTISSSMVKDYLVNAMEEHPEAHILYGPIDTSIFNRIPYEVEMCRSIKDYEEKQEEEEEPVSGENEEDLSDK